MPKQLGALFLVAGVALTAACGAPAATGGPGAGVAVPAPAAATGVHPVTVTVGNSMRFAAASIAVRVGQPAELTLRNGGGLPHDFTLTEGKATIQRGRP
jgi:uncharacterized cupredoxin-like copper-binding protein